MGTSDSAFLLKAYDNGDHTCLVWLTPDAKPIPGCRGFTVRRIKNGLTDYLHGMVGFSDTDTLDPENPWKFPLQRFIWWDYLVTVGDTVQYSVVPVVGDDKDHLALATDLASPLSPALTVTGQRTAHVSAYFNKGIVAAQWVAHALAATPKGSSIKTLVATPGNPLRNALSGLLRPQILSLLADAKAQNEKIFAALYELNDPELIPALTAFGSDCSLILANGAFSAKDPDENAAVRAQLRDSSQVTLIDRLVSEGHFAHNKFVVFCDSAGNPLRVLTGSTNWTTSGLCTQANNAVVIEDPDVAAAYLDAWTRIKAAGNGYPPELITGNSTAATVPLDGGAVTPWFASTSHAQDLDDARDADQRGEGWDSLLVLQSRGLRDRPGEVDAVADHPCSATAVRRQPELRSESLRPRRRQPNDRGPDGAPGTPRSRGGGRRAAGAPAAAPQPGASPVTLIRGAAAPPQSFGQEVLVPHNIKSQFGDWEQELLGASMVNIHSKVIVLDPLGEKPVVMTGSHNLGLKASSKNDDNLVIIEGNQPLALAYAINVIAIFDAYRWNSYVEAHRADPNVWHGLVDNDQWQSNYLQGQHLAEVDFWLGRR